MITQCDWELRETNPRVAKDLNLPITSLRGPWERESVACRAFILRVFSEANGLFHVDKDNSYCTEAFFNTHYISEHIGFTILINESKCNVICVQK